MRKICTRGLRRFLCTPKRPRSSYVSLALLTSAPVLYVENEGVSVLEKREFSDFTRLHVGRTAPGALHTQGTESAGKLNKSIE